MGVVIVLRVYPSKDLLAIYGFQAHVRRLDTPDPVTRLNAALQGRYKIERQRIMIEADAYSPGPANVPSPTTPNPLAAALRDNIQQLGLNVRQILAIHGPRVATMADLRAAAGR